MRNWVKGRKKRKGSYEIEKLKTTFFMQWIKEITTRKQNQTPNY